MFSWFEKQIDPFPKDTALPKKQGLVAFCWHYVKDGKYWLLAMSLVSAIIGVGEVLLYALMGKLVDWLTTGDPSHFFVDHAAALILFAVFVLLVMPLAALMNGTIVHQVINGNVPMSIRWRFHRQILGQHIGFFTEEFAGRISTKLMQTALAVRETVTKVLDILVYVAAIFISIIFIVGAADLRLLAPLLVWGVAYFGMLYYFVPRIKNISMKQADARSTMTGRIVDSYTNISTVKLFARDGIEETYAREGMQDFLQTVHPQMRLANLFWTLTYTNNCVAVFGVCAASIYLWQAELVSVGAIAAAIALTLRLNGLCTWIMWEISALFENIGIIHDGMEMFTKRALVTDRPDAAALVIRQGAVSFREVTFHYGKGGGVIDHLNLHIAPGEKVGLVGRSGAGKTTLTNLLLRFYDVEAGTVSIDGQDVRQVTQDSLRSQIGVVTQDTSLLHRSIRENVAYGCSDASDDAVIEALTKANAMSFIEALEDRNGRRGLDAVVGERGVKLSGGQRQRIAIARLFLKNAPILVLDEATSALDSEIEAAIQDNLFALMEGKTVIAIAHRLSTIASLDRLVVLDSGKVVEQGSHEELVVHGGLYAGLWAHQSGGFLGPGLQHDQSDLMHT